MPFPANVTITGDRPKAPPKGKSRSRRYGIAWAYREDPSNDDDLLHRTEVRSTNIGSAVTALLRELNAGLERDHSDYLRKSSIVVVEARVLDRGESYASTEE